MKIRQILLAGAMFTLITTSSAYATNPQNNGNGNSCKSNGLASLSLACFGGDAPEIDAASGTHAIALLVGGLLLASERLRSRCA